MTRHLHAPRTRSLFAGPAGTSPLAWDNTEVSDFISTLVCFKTSHIPPAGSCATRPFALTTQRFLSNAVSSLCCGQITTLASGSHFQCTAVDLTPNLTQELLRTNRLAPSHGLRRPPSPPCLNASGKGPCCSSLLPHSAACPFPLHRPRLSSLSSSSYW